MHLIIINYFKPVQWKNYFIEIVIIILMSYYYTRHRHQRNGKEIILTVCYLFSFRRINGPTNQKLQSSHVL